MAAARDWSEAVASLSRSARLACFESWSPRLAVAEVALAARKDSSCLQLALRSVTEVVCWLAGQAL